MILSAPINFIWTETELANLDFWANLTLFGIATLFAYPMLQLVAAFYFKGRWRILALLPIVITGPVIIYTILQFWRGAGLWFIVAIYVLPPATLYLVVVAAMHWFACWQGRRPAQ
jgi:hypothetical protein